GRAHRPHDELRPSAGHVFVETLAQQRRRAERGAALERRVVHAIARDERRRQRARRGAIASEAEIDERAEMIRGHLPSGLRGEPLRLYDPSGEAIWRNEGGDPAVAEPSRAAHGRLAVAADPRGHRLLDWPRQHGDLVQPPELALEGDLILAPAPTHDRQRLVRAPAALLERHA